MEDGRYLYRCAKEYLALELLQGGHFARDAPLTKEEERKYKEVATYLIERSFIALGANHEVRGWILRGRDNNAPLLVHGYWEVIFLDFNFARACLFAYSELHPDLPARLVIFEHEALPLQSDYL